MHHRRRGDALKRLAFLVAVLVAGVSAVAAMAAPAPKTTGGIGYTVGSDVQRQLSFNAIQSKTDTCGTFWNVTGVSQFSFRLTGDTTDYTHHVTLTQSGQTVGGSGGYPLTGGDTYHWNVTAGSAIGNAFSLTWVYDALAPDAVGVVNNMTGTIAPDGSISGTWSDNYGGAPAPAATRGGTFTAPAGSATAFATYCGKGTAYYSDAAGIWYLVNVKAVKVVGDNAWFAGPVVAGNLGATAPNNWLFVKVHDGGEPGKLVDQVWGQVTDEITAVNGVTAGATPTTGPVTITSGNLQVH